MKKYLFILLLLSIFAYPTHAQKYACVNTDYIFAHIPDYKQAQTRLNKYVEDWRTELETKFTELDKLKQDFEKEAYLLPDGLKRRRQEEIKTKEQEVRTLQQQRFKKGGDLDSKRAELMKPVQDRVYNAIERIANEKSYAFVFDKSASATVLFANERYDISDQVLEMLGYSPSTNPNEKATNNNQPKTFKGANNPEMNRNYQNQSTPSLNSILK